MVAQEYISLDEWEIGELGIEYDDQEPEDRSISCQDESEGERSCGRSPGKKNPLGPEAVVGQIAPREAGEEPYQRHAGEDCSDGRGAQAALEEVQRDERQERAVGHADEHERPSDASDVRFHA